MRRWGVLLVAVSACGEAPVAHVPGAPVASGGAGPPRAPGARVLVEGVQGAWPVEGAVLVVRGTGRERRLARLDGDGLVDEPLLSCGLPARDPPCGTKNGETLPVEVTALGGRWPGMLLLGLSCAGGFGHTRLYAFDGACWSERADWADDAGMLVARPEWQSGRGFLFGLANQVEGGSEWPAYLLDPIPARPPDLMKAAIPMPRPDEARMSHTWVSADGSRLSVPTGDQPFELVAVGRKAPPAPRVELGPPIYVRADGTLVASTAMDPAIHVVLCGVTNERTPCSTLAAPVAPTAFRDVGGHLHAFTAEPGFRVLRLDGERWVDVPSPGLAGRVIAPIGEASGGSLLLLVERDGRRDLIRWTP